MARRLTEWADELHPHHNLWRLQAKLVKLTQPKVVLIENVPWRDTGAHPTKHQYVKLRQELEELGYHVEERDDAMFRSFEMKSEEEDMEMNKPQRVRHSDSDSDESTVMNISDSEAGEDQKEQSNSAPHWVRLYDSTHVAYYYFQNSTGETTWDRPEGFISPRNVSDMKVMMQFLNRDVKAALLVQKTFRQMRAKRVANQARLVSLQHGNGAEYDIGDWAAMQDGGGNEYYVHKFTGKAVWELPTTEEWEHGVGGYGHPTHSEYHEVPQRSPSFGVAASNFGEAVSDYHHSSGGDYDPYAAYRERKRRQSQIKVPVVLVKKSSAYAYQADSVSEERHQQQHHQAKHGRRGSRVLPPGVNPPRPGGRGATVAPYAMHHPVSAGGKEGGLRRRSVMKPDGTWLAVPA